MARTRLAKMPDVYPRQAREQIRKLRQNMGEHPVVLEIGCNDGMHTKIFLEEVPNIRIYCFEPDPRPVARFHASVGHDPRVSFFPIAIAAKTGPVPWFASGGVAHNSWLDDWDLSGSIRRPTGHLQLSPWVTFREAGTVPGVALDDWVAEHLAEHDGQIDLIFADVQGAEGDLIEGGKNTFANHVRYWWTEYYDVPQYEGQLNLHQLLQRLPGYVVVDKQAQDAYLKNTGFLLPIKVKFPVPILKDLQAILPLHYFVETGTAGGHTVTALAPYFERAITIELDPSVHAETSHRLSRIAGNIVCLYGDAPELLPSVIKELDGGTVFWLDAHWCGGPRCALVECPVLSELNCIRQSPHDNVIVIDDIRLFQAPPPAPHRAEDWPDISCVRGALPAGYLSFIYKDCLVAIPPRPQVVDWFNQFRHTHATEITA